MPMPHARPPLGGDPLLTLHCEGTYYSTVHRYLSLSEFGTVVDQGGVGGCHNVLRTAVPPSTPLCENGELERHPIF